MEYVSKPSSDVLELGAGTGFLTKELFQFNCNIDAIDISENMINIGRNNLPSVNWMIQDAWNLSLNKKYDYIYSSSLLHWAKNPKNVLKNWKLHLKPDGKIIVFLYTKGTLGDLALLGPIKWREIEEWQNMFKEAELSIIHEKNKCVHYSYGNKLELLRYVKNTGMYSKNNSNISDVLKWVRRNFTSSLSVPWCFYLVECG